MRLLTAVLAGVVVCVPAGVGADTGNNLIEECRAFLGNENPRPLQAFKRGTCFGIVRALWDMSDVIRLDGKQYFCPPKDATMGQLLKVVVRYADQHPELLNSPMSFIAASALHDAWPCG